MALTTLDEIKTFLGIPLVDTSKDALLTMFKDSVETSVINFCDTDFTIKTVTNEVLDGVRSDVIIPHNTPIVSITAVRLGVEMDGSGGLLLDTIEYNFDDSGITLRNVHTPFSRGAVRVDYTWGYAAVPADVKMCVYQSVKAEYQRYKRNSEDVNSRSKGDESESYGGINSAWDSYTGLPKQIMAKLQHYKLYEFPLINTAQRNI
jgi:hypothetical protein